MIIVSSYLSAVSVISVSGHASGLYYKRYDNAKDVTLPMSSKENQETSPTDTTSAPDVTPKWSLDVWLSGDLSVDITTVKCSDCKVPTPHEWLKVTPYPVITMDDMLAIASRSRRLIMCTQCGLTKTIT